MFLCARRHNVADTLKLLDKYLKKRKELGFDVNPPSIKEESLKKHFESGMVMCFCCCMHISWFDDNTTPGVMMQHKGAKDKFGRMLNYVYVAKDKPKDRPISTLYSFHDLFIQ